MSITSFYFFLFLLGGILVYYLVPKKMQWIILVALNIIFYYYATTFYTILFIVGSTVLAYFSTLVMASEKMRNCAKGSKWICVITLGIIILNIVVWFLVKGSSFWILGSSILSSLNPNIPILSALPIIAPLGMGYYTAQIISYILDCYWGNCEPQKNILKLFLFISFFPQLIVGPISRYSQMQDLYKKHYFCFENICFGSQRILWGMFKKLVISDRVGVIVNAIWRNSQDYNGIYPWIAVFLFPLQIYTDFSGCMDIVLGAAELFDIRLPENFKNPFFARSCQEFWQRWHITLGTWAKDYVYYPVLKSRLFYKIGKWAKKHFSKRTAKLIPWTLGMGILWFVMGFWHGSVQHIFGVSLWFWTILVISEFMSPLSKKIIQIMKIDVECFSWKFFQRIRTYILYSLGVVFFSADGLMEAIRHYGILFRGMKQLNPWIFFDGSIFNLGVTEIDLNIIVIGMALLIIVANLRERYEYARIWIKKQMLPFRWTIWLFLFVMVLIFGLYGPGYDASVFIYEGF